MKKMAIALSALLFLLTAATRPPHPQAVKTVSSTKTPNWVDNTWTVDPVHSNVKFTVSHLVVSEVEGSFKIFEGTLLQTGPDFSGSRINFSVNVNSVNTDNENRDKHLKSDDFFNAEKYPLMKFESSSLEALGDNKYKLTGNLTIRDVTKAVVFDVTYGGTIATQMGTKAGFRAKTSINRFDYNLKWDRATEAGGLVVGKDVEISLNIELNKAK